VPLDRSLFFLWFFLHERHPSLSRRKTVGMIDPEVARRAGLLATELRALLTQMEQVAAYHARSGDLTLPCSLRGAARTGMGKGSQEDKATCLFEGVRALLNVALLLRGSVIETGADLRTMPRAHLATVGLPHPDLF